MYGDLFHPIRHVPGLPDTSMDGLTEHQVSNSGKCDEPRTSQYGRLAGTRQENERKKPIFLKFKLFSSLFSSHLHSHLHPHLLSHLTYANKTVPLTTGLVCRNRSDNSAWVITTDVVPALTSWDSFYEAKICRRVRSEIKLNCVTVDGDGLFAHRAPDCFAHSGCYMV